MMETKNARKRNPAALMVPLIAAFLGAAALMIAGIIGMSAASSGLSSINMAGIGFEPRSFGLAALFLGLVAIYICYRLAITAIFLFRSDAEEQLDGRGNG